MVGITYTALLARFQVEGKWWLMKARSVVWNIFGARTLGWILPGADTT
jgi:hypothetical protein